MILLPLSLSLSLSPKFLRRSCIFNQCVSLLHTTFESNHSDNDNNNITLSPGSRDIGKETCYSPSSIFLRMEFHLVLAVSNIKNHIPIILETNKDQYGILIELLHIHARSHRVLHHIVSSMDKKPLTDTSVVEYEQ